MVFRVVWGAFVSFIVAVLILIFEVIFLVFENYWGDFEEKSFFR